MSGAVVGVGKGSREERETRSVGRERRGERAGGEGGDERESTIEIEKTSHFILLRAITSFLLKGDRL